MPHIGIVQGEPREYRERLRNFADAQAISVEYSSEIAPARGTSSGGHIGQSEAEEFSTLAHELAHLCGVRSYVMQRAKAPMNIGVGIRVHHITLLLE